MICLTHISRVSRHLPRRDPLLFFICVPRRVLSEAELASYPTGWYLKCLNLNSYPTKIMACSTPMPSSRSLSYSAMKAPELMSPRNISRASTSVEGAGESSTLMVLGLYQCTNPSFLHETMLLAYVDV